MTARDFLRLDGVTKRFGGVVAVDDVSIDVRQGSITGVIGPNGSGKTTLANVITGFVRPDRGRVRFGGRDVTRLAPHRRVALGIVRTFQTARPFPRLTAVESLVVPLRTARARRGRWGHRAAVAMDLLEEVGFERDSPVPAKAAGALPQGYLRRLELARCLALEAELVVTDELFSGLSDAEVQSLVPLLEKLQASGLTLIMVEHRLRDLFRLSDRVIVLDRGSVIAEGTPDDVAGDAALRDAYLGAEA